MSCFTFVLHLFMCDMSLGHVTELPHVGGGGLVSPPRGQPRPEAVVGAEDGGALGGGHPRVEDPAALAALGSRGHSDHWRICVF